MSSGSGYDVSASVFSPEGRIFQIEYAQKAVDNSGTAIGLRGLDGCVFAVENLVKSKLYEAGANKRIFTVNCNIGVAIAGLYADARKIVEIAKLEAAAYRKEKNEAVPLNLLKDRVSMFMHSHTLYSFVRPFGVSVILGAYEHGGSQMYCIDPSGESCGYYGCAIGKGRQAAKIEMEKINFKENTIAELVKEAAKIIYTVHDDKDFELELSWVGKETSGKHELVPTDVFEEAVAYAKASLEGDDDIDDEDL